MPLTLEPTATGTQSSTGAARESVGWPFYFVVVPNSAVYNSFPTGRSVGPVFYAIQTPTLALALASPTVMLPSTASSSETPTANGNNGASTKGLTKGGIAGIVLGSLALFLALCLALLICALLLRSRRSRRSRPGSTSTSTSMPMSETGSGPLAASARQSERQKEKKKGKIRGLELAPPLAPTRAFLGESSSSDAGTIPSPDLGVTYPPFRDERFPDLVGMTTRGREASESIPVRNMEYVDQVVSPRPRPFSYSEELSSNDSFPGPDPDPSESKDAHAQNEEQKELRKARERGVLSHARVESLSRDTSSAKATKVASLSSLSRSGSGIIPHPSPHTSPNPFSTNTNTNPNLNPLIEMGSGTGKVSGEGTVNSGRPELVRVSKGTGLEPSEGAIVLF